MKEICINLDEYNRDSINTIQGNNNAEVYKIYVLFNKRRIDLTGKTVKMAYLRTGTVEGDVINLNVTNATKGEITLQITNSISKRDGVYSCQLAIYGADGFLEHTATFGLTVEANIFNQIANEIADNKDLTYIESILKEAKNISNNLKTNIPVATNLKSSLESNINNARNINTTLADTTEQSKVAATDAIEKKSQLEKSITKAKEFIDGLDGSQNIPQLRLDVTELQNGLKSNQALAYTGSSISADNTLEGRTEGMKIEGKTMYKKADGTYTDTWEEGVTLESFGETEGNKISILSNGKNLGLKYKTSNNSNIEFNLISDIKENVNCNISFDGEGMGILDRNTVYYTPALGGQYSKGTATKTGNIIKSTVLTFTRDEIKNLLEGTATIKIYANNLINSYKPKWTQLEYGTETTSYEPYKCDKKDILIKSPLRENDVMYEDNGQVKVYRPTEQYTFTGNETSIIKWATVKDENFIVFCITNDDIPNLTSKRSLVVCNNFPSVDGVITKRNMYIAANSVNICIEKSALATPDIEGFRAWLKANPTTIVYQLAAPTVEIVENCVDIDLDTFIEKTYFNILNSLPGTLDFKVPSNIGSVVQNMAKEVNNIWDVINNLLVPSIVKANGNLAMLKLNNNLN